MTRVLLGMDHRGVANRFRALGFMVLPMESTPVGEWFPVAGWTEGDQELVAYCRPGEAEQRCKQAKRLLFG